MRIKRTVLLVAMSLVVVAVAAPAMATASGTWTDNHLKLTNDATIELSGGLEFGSALGGFGCEVHVEATLTWSFGGTTKTGTGHLEKFQPTTDTCVGTGALAGCVLVDHEPRELPWMLTAKSKDISVTGAILFYAEFNEECAVEEAEFTFEELTLDPDNAKTISQLEITGGGTMDVVGSEIAVGAAGTLTPLGEAAGTYGVH